MTKRRPAVLIWDAIEAAERLQQFVAGRTGDDYLADDLLRAAVERQFGIIGEALSVLRRTAPDVAGSIEALPKAVGFRNELVHGYATISHSQVWQIVETRVTPLLSQSRATLSRLEAG